MKIATTGTGFIVDWFLQALSQVDDLECVGMYTRNSEKAQGLADKFKIKKIYNDYDAMLADSSIDAIYIASCNSMHFPQAKKALLAHKHVLCEKPFTPTLKEFDELVQLANTNKCLLMEAIVTIHMPNYAQIKANLKQLGDIKLVQCNFSQYSSRYTALLNGELPNVFNPAFAGGCLGDINIYNLHFVIGLFGQPDSVTYHANKISNGIDTSGVVFLSYPNFKCICVAAKDSESNSSTQIQGNIGYIEVCSKTSMVGHAQLVINNNITPLSQPQNDVALYYELVEFKAIFEQLDFNKAASFLKHSRIVVDTYEKARLSAGIIFTNVN